MTRCSGGEKTSYKYLINKQVNRIDLPAYFGEAERITLV